MAESVLDLAGVEDYEALDKVTVWLKEKKLSTLKELAGLASAAFEPARPTRALYAGRDLLTAPCVSDRANSRPWQRVPIETTYLTAWASRARCHAVRRRRRCAR